MHKFEDACYHLFPIRPLVVAKKWKLLGWVLRIMEKGAIIVDSVLVLESSFLFL